SGSEWLDWLGEVPTPDGAREDGNQRSSYAAGAHVLFTSDASVEELVEFYEQELPMRGFAVTGSMMIGSASLRGRVSFEALPRAASATIEAMGDGTTSVRLQA